MADAPGATTAAAAPSTDSKVGRGYYSSDFTNVDISNHSLLTTAKRLVGCDILSATSMRRYDAESDDFTNIGRALNEPGQFSNNSALTINVHRTNQNPDVSNYFPITALTVKFKNEFADVVESLSPILEQACVSGFDSAKKRLFMANKYLAGTAEALQKYGIVMDVKLQFPQIDEIKEEIRSKAGEIYHLKQNIENPWINKLKSVVFGAANEIKHLERRVERAEKKRDEATDPDKKAARETEIKELKVAVKEKTDRRDRVSKILEKRGLTGPEYKIKAREEAKLSHEFESLRLNSLTEKKDHKISETASILYICQAASNHRSKVEAEWDMARQKLVKNDPNANTPPPPDFEKGWKYREVSYESAIKLYDYILNDFAESFDRAFDKNYSDRMSIAQFGKEELERVKPTTPKRKV